MLHQITCALFSHTTFELGSSVSDDRHGGRQEGLAWWLKKRLNLWFFKLIAWINKKWLEKRIFRSTLSTPTFIPSREQRTRYQFHKCVRFLTHKWYHFPFADNGFAAIRKAIAQEVEKKVPRLMSEWNGKKIISSADDANEKTEQRN